MFKVCPLLHQSEFTWCNNSKLIYCILIYTKLLSWLWPDQMQQD